MWDPTMTRERERERDGKVVGGTGKKINCVRGRFEECGCDDAREGSQRIMVSKGITSRLRATHIDMAV